MLETYFLALKCYMKNTLLRGPCLVSQPKGPGTGHWLDSQCHTTKSRKQLPVLVPNAKSWVTIAPSQFSYKRNLRSIMQ